MPKKLQLSMVHGVNLVDFKTFSFIGTTGVNRQLPDSITPYNAFTLFIDNEIIDLFVVETNRYL